MTDLREIAREVRSAHIADGLCFITRCRNCERAETFRNAATPQAVLALIDECDALVAEVERERKIVNDLRLYLFGDHPSINWPKHDLGGVDAAAEDYACVVAEHGLQVICQHRGHKPMQDQCRKPEHDYCSICMTKTPGMAKRG